MRHHIMQTLTEQHHYAVRRARHWRESAAITGNGLDRADSFFWLEEAAKIRRRIMAGEH